jgi:CBS domain-containing protein
MNAVLDIQSVGDLMTDDPIVAQDDMPLADAAAIMDFYRVSALPVVDWNGSLVGVISESDLLHARTTESLWEGWLTLVVRQLMTQPAVTVTAETALDVAAELMERLRIHRLVVVDAEGETPIGVLSVSDLVHSMAERSPL